MNRLVYFILIFSLLNFLTSCNGQTKDNNQTVSNNPTVKSKLVGGGCDGCEIMYVGMPTNISSVDTSAGWTEKGQKLLVTGTVFKLDGKTPAPNVVIYYWKQTIMATIHQNKEWTKKPNATDTFGVG